MEVYFDNAATTRVRDEVVDEISDLLKNCFGILHQLIPLVDLLNHILKDLENLLLRF